MDLVVKHNQKSLWDNARTDSEENPYYDKNKNPMRRDQKMFNDFMKNSYWKELYNNSSENLKKYYTFKFNNNDKEYTESMIKELEK